MIDFERDRPEFLRSREHIHPSFNQTSIAGAIVNPTRSDFFAVDNHFSATATRPVANQ